MATAAKIPHRRAETANRKPAERRAGRRPRTAPSPAQTAFYFPQQIDNSRLVKVADPRERRAQTRLVMAAMLVVCAVLVSLYPRFALMRTGYRIEELQKEREQLLEDNRQLRLQEATLRDPHRIDAIARNQLGMVVAAPGQVARIDALASEGDPVVARVQPPDSQGMKRLGNPAP